MNKIIPKFYPEKYNDNLIIEVIIKSSNEDIFKCVGVLIKEYNNGLRLGFNARNNEVLDYLDIIPETEDVKEIVDVRLLSNTEIYVLE